MNKFEKFAFLNFSRTHSKSNSPSLTSSEQSTKSFQSSTRIFEPIIDIDDVNGVSGDDEFYDVAVDIQRTSNIFPSEKPTSADVSSIVPEETSHLNVTNVQKILNNSQNVENLGSSSLAQTTPFLKINKKNYTSAPYYFTKEYNDHSTRPSSTKPAQTTANSILENLKGTTFYPRVITEKTKSDLSMKPSQKQTVTSTIGYNSADYTTTTNIVEKTTKAPEVIIRNSSEESTTAKLAFYTENTKDTMIKLPNSTEYMTSTSQGEYSLKIDSTTKIMPNPISSTDLPMPS